MDIPSSLLGKIVEVRFTDHVHGTNVTTLSDCVVWGKLLKANGTMVIVQQWRSDDSDIEDTENAVLIQSAIYKVTYLEPVE